MNKLTEDFYNKNPYPDLTKGSRYRINKHFFEEACQKASLKIPVNPKILILGCGTTAPRLIASIYPDAAKIYAVDISYKTIQIAQKECGKFLKDCIKWINADISSDDFLKTLDGEKFHWIHCTGVLHHIGNPENAVKNISATLEDDGIVKFQVYSKGARLWIELARNFFISENITDIKQAQKLLSKLPKDSPIFFALATYPESLNNFGFNDGFLNPVVKLYYFDEWQQIFNNNNLTTIFLEKSDAIDDLHDIFPEKFYQYINQLEFCQKVSILEKLGEWRSDFRGVLVKKTVSNSKIFINKDFKTSEILQIPKNMSLPRYYIWNEFKKALYQISDTYETPELECIIDNLSDRLWLNNLLGLYLRFKWLSIKDSARKNATYSLIFKEQKDFLYNDLLTQTTSLLPDIKQWAQPHWTKGMTNWFID